MSGQPTSAWTVTEALPEDPSSGSVYVLPAGIVAGVQAASALASGQALPLAGGPFAFTQAGVIQRKPEGGATFCLASLAGVQDWATRQGNQSFWNVQSVLARASAPRAPWAGLAMDRPVVMGIVNVTPDSFSDGGETGDAEAAIARGLAMAEAGAAIIDVGGESTRPGADPVSVDAEIARVVPVIGALVGKGIVVSVDTRHAAVMEAGVAAGAKVINDIAALTGPGAMDVAARTGAAVCLMHMRGEPRTMQDAPVYASAPLDVYDFLEARVADCEQAGIPAARIAVDPGIGFGKTTQHNAQILGAQALFHGLGCPILLGVSRKRFIASLSRGEAPGERVAGSLAAALGGLDAGVQIVRVHDVAETAQALAVWQGIKAGG